MKAETVLVTGGGGFVGTHWCRALAEAGAAGTILDVYPQSAPLPANWRYVRGDVRDRALVMSLMAEHTRVVHLAAAHHDAGISADTYESVNVDGTAIVLEAMAAHDVHDLIFTSTVAVYGGSASDESSPTAPTSPYGKTKLAAEALIAEWAQGNVARHAVVLRPAVIVGTGHMANMYALMRQMTTGLFVRIANANNIKSMAAVTNVVAAGEWLRSNAPLPMTIANVIDGPPMTSDAIISFVAQSLDARFLPVEIPLGFAMSVAGVLESVTRMLGRDPVITRERVRKFAETETLFEGHVLAESGFSAPTSLRDALREMAQWFRAAGNPPPRVQRVPPSAVLMQQGGTPLLHPAGT
jgi:nucleoside-diphosphate-sugar epimerase